MEYLLPPRPSRHSRARRCRISLGGAAKHSGRPLVGGARSRMETAAEHPERRLAVLVDLSDVPLRKRSLSVANVTALSPLSWHTCPSQSCPRCTLATPCGSCSPLPQPFSATPPPLRLHAGLVAGVCGLQRPVVPHVLRHRLDLSGASMLFLGCAPWRGVAQSPSLHRTQAGQREKI